jgi:uncharacterized protein (DUF58 family)
MSLGVWLALLLGIVVLGSLIQLPWLVFFATSIAILLWVSHTWRKSALRNLYYRRRWRYTRGFPGETNHVQLEVENRKRLPLSWARFTDQWPVEVPTEERQLLTPTHIVDRGLLTNLYSLRGFQKVQRLYPLRFGKRGIYPVGPVEVESGDLFGLLESAQTLPLVETLTVFPEILPLSALKLPAEDPFGDRNAPRRLFEDPNRTVGVRGYRPEDEMRRIHWPASARTGELQVRVYQPVSARVLMVCLNVNLTEQTWQGGPAEALEQLVKISATLAYEGIQDGYSVGLISNGTLARADHPFRILPGRSQQHLAMLLQALAGVTQVSSGSFETFLMRTLPQVPLGATLLVVTAIVPEVLAETLTALHRYRLHTTLISIAPDAPRAIPGVRVVHLPFQA